MKKTTFDIHSDLENKHWWFVARRQIILPLVDLVMAECRNDRIVDVGCGTGGTVAAFSEKYNIMGVDSSGLSIDMAKESYPHCHFLCGSMPEDLSDYASETGLFLLMDVLEHVEKDRTFLSDLVSLARPGSHILITVPAGKNLWSSHDVIAEHHRRYEYNDFPDLWRGLPVEARLVSYLNARLYPVIRLIRFLTSRLGISAGRQGSDFSIPPMGINSLLARLFAGEATPIITLLDQPERSAYSKGVSLIALLRKN